MISNTLLLGDKGTSSHIELLNRSLRSNIKVEDIDGQSQSRAGVGDLLLAVSDEFFEKAPRVDGEEGMIRSTHINNSSNMPLNRRTT